MPNGSGPLEAWPTAQIGVELTMPRQRALSALEVIGLVQLTVKTGPKESMLRFVSTPYFDDAEALAIGQSSPYIEHQLIALPTEGNRPFFYLDDVYSGVRITSQRWEAASRTMARTSERDVIEAVKVFAARLRSAYLHALAMDEFPIYHDE